MAGETAHSRAFWSCPSPRTAAPPLVSDIASRPELQKRSSCVLLFSLLRRCRRVLPAWPLCAVSGAESAHARHPWPNNVCACQHAVQQSSQLSTVRARAVGWRSVLWRRDAISLNCERIFLGYSAPSEKLTTAHTRSNINIYISRLLIRFTAHKRRERALSPLAFHCRAGMLSDNPRERTRPTSQDAHDAMCQRRTSTAHGHAQRTSHTIIEP